MLAFVAIITYTELWIEIFHTSINVLLKLSYIKVNIQ